jgi:CBS domain-containing protein
MNCGEIMNGNVESLKEHDTIATAAAVMADSGVGFLPICDAQGRAVGVVTDRDVTVRAVAKNVPLDMPATSIMTAPAIICLSTGSVSVAEALMAEERLSRLVITDRDGRVAGVLSLADLIEHAPARAALRTARAVLWREALGPRGGAMPGAPLLKDASIAPEPAAREHGDGAAKTTVFTGGHRSTSTKEFPG